MASQFTPPPEYEGPEYEPAEYDGDKLVATGRLDGCCTGAGGVDAAIAARSIHALRGCQVLSRSRWPTTMASGLPTLCRLVHHRAGQSARLPYACLAMSDRVSPGLTVSWPGTWWAGPACSEIVTPIRAFATPTAGILNMSGFLLRLIRHTRSRRGAATPGRDRYWLANNARERHLLSPQGGGVT